MTTYFGIPLFGSLFLPLVVGIATVFFFWTFILSKKSLQSTTESGDVSEKINLPKEKMIGETKRNAKDKGKKKCGTSGGCCSTKGAKSGGCSDSNQAILGAKVFVDNESSNCQEFAGVLAKRLTENLGTELINISLSESIDLTGHADGSLCIFIIDTTVSDAQPHCLLKALRNFGNTEKPLSGMKYSVFAVHGVPTECKAEAVDQLLHKSGAVRVCRAQNLDITAATSLNLFDEWAEEVLSQIQLWNSPKKKSCQCGPKKKKNNENESCSSSDCSSEDEEGKNASPSEPVLDLEDIAKLL